MSSHHPKCFQSLYTPEQLIAQELPPTSCDCRVWKLFEDEAAVRRLEAAVADYPNWIVGKRKGRRVRYFNTKTAAWDSVWTSEGE